MLQEIIHTSNIRGKVTGIHQSVQPITPTLEHERIGIAKAVHKLDSATPQLRYIYMSLSPHTYSEGPRNPCT